MKIGRSRVTVKVSQPKKGPGLEITLKIPNAHIQHDRRRPSRPVIYLAKLHGLLPFKVDFGQGVVRQPRIVLRIYHPAKSLNDRYLIGKAFIQSP